MFISTALIHGTSIQKSFFSGRIKHFCSRALQLAANRKKRVFETRRHCRLPVWQFDSWVSVFTALWMPRALIYLSQQRRVVPPLANASRLNIFVDLLCRSLYFERTEQLRVSKIKVDVYNVPLEELKKENNRGYWKRGLTNRDGMIDLSSRISRGAGVCSKSSARWKQTATKLTSGRI